jgi:hypothetical protein
VPEDTKSRTAHSDLTFITNEGEQTLLERFKVLIRDTRFFDGYTEEDDLYLKRLIQELEEGGIAKRTACETHKALHAELKKGINPLRILAVLKLRIPLDDLEQRRAETKASSTEPREVILSEYLTGSET